MCGIFGFVDRGGRLSEADGAAALATLRSRGPNASRTLKLEQGEATVFLGHTRLSVIDLSEAGNQPMRTPDGRVSLVYNGEIYGFQALRRVLEEMGCRFIGHGDSEVLLHGIHRWGEDVAAKLDGMFAYAAHDGRAGTVTLARDHFGKKPLHYYLDDDVFAFASEQKALLALAPIRQKLTIDRAALTKFLYYGYIPSPHGIFKEIRKLEPASILRFDIGKWTLGAPRTFWTLSPGDGPAPRSEDEILERLDGLIDDAVRRRLVADVPIGMFLSGGIDSSLVANAVARNGGDLTAITVSYPNAPEVDETAHARHVADRLGIELIVRPFEDETVFERFTEILDYLDEPMADIAIAPLFNIAKVAREHMTVVLGGDGGDELFGGYPKYRAQRAIERLGPLRHPGAMLKGLFPADSPYHKLFACFPLDFPVRQFIFGSGGFLPDEVARLTGERQDIDAVFEDASRWDRACPFGDAVDRALYLDCRIQLPDWYLVKADRATMAASLELRSPLLDISLAEFAFSLGGRWKLRGGTDKYLLKKLAERHFDRDFAYRPKKGFGVPLDRWIRDDHRDLFGDVLFRDNGWFARPMIERLHADHMAGKARNEFKLYRIFAFNYWLARFGQAGGAFEPGSRDELSI